ncbi:uncharacterized protein BDZ99DRAFT_398868 [Mytilinidion resinicola]|uniref:Apoptosis-inducing TAF9-like domain 1 family protein n=1 Tax=Mytilinidion resinicola TaxID=574789 RepID=A0A6A6Y5L4_9PEZI|nr:uncharacterized protein BDZ99DRAFT_398868 [Mytilinidion resinicola]KAF2803950.1 hypothetical protein BDZ99DRAFT_398868 [Mytilinidion resinicola]
MSDDDSTRDERLKSALWYSIGQFVDEQCLQQNLNATPQFIGALTELVWTQIANTSRDLETFAKHAGREVVQTEDVMLLTRRNEGLESVMKTFVDELRAKEGRPAVGGVKGKGKGKGKVGAKGRR